MTPTRPALARRVASGLALVLLLGAATACADDDPVAADKRDGTGQLVLADDPTATPSPIAGGTTGPTPGTPTAGATPTDTTTAGATPTDAPAPTETPTATPPSDPPADPATTPDGSISAVRQDPGCPFLAGEPEIIPDWDLFSEDDQAALSPLVRFASGMQVDDYDCAWDAMGPDFQGRSAGRAQWQAEQSTTDIASYEILALDRVDADTVVVETRWQSLQDPEYARGDTGETCTTWPLQYRLARTDGVWHLDRLLGGGDEATAC